ncbi:putative GABA permease [Aspergillus californicus]
MEHDREKKSAERIDASMEEVGKERSQDVGETYELKKRFSRFTILSMTVILMATWEALSSTMVSALISGGPVSLVYGYILALVGSLATAASLGELSSMYTTAGGQYHFTAKLAPTKLKNILSWAVGWIGTFGWIAFAASAPFLAATMIQGLVVLNHETYVPERWQGTLIYWALVFIATALNIWGTRLLSLVESASLVIHIGAFIGNFVVIWICAPVKHPAEFVFATFQNNSGWSSSGVAWSLGMLSSCYVLTGFDGAIHLSEEMNNPTTAVPYCMLSSVLLNGAMGFAFLLTVLFCMGDMDTALNSATGFPIIEIFRTATGSSAATIPGHIHLAKLDKKTQMPATAVMATSTVLVLLGLINIGSTTAFNAIISLAVLGLQVSYLVPVALMLWRRLISHATLVYGPWRMGRFGVAINVVSLVYLIYTSIFMVFPPYQPVTAENMNYASLIFGAVLIFSGVYWVWKGRRQYNGPDIHILA